MQASQCDRSCHEGVHADSINPLDAKLRPTYFDRASAMNTRTKLRSIVQKRCAYTYTGVVVQSVLGNFGTPGPLSSTSRDFCKLDR